MCNTRIIHNAFFQSKAEFTLLILNIKCNFCSPLPTVHSRKLGIMLVITYKGLSHDGLTTESMELIKLLDNSETVFWHHFQGPLLRGWFLILDRGFGPTRTIKDAAKKLFFDQFAFAPILTAILLPVFGFSQGMDRFQVNKKLKAVSFCDELQNQPL